MSDCDLVFNFGRFIDSPSSVWSQSHSIVVFLWKLFEFHSVSLANVSILNPYNTVKMFYGEFIVLNVSLEISTVLMEISTVLLEISTVFFGNQWCFVECQYCFVGDCLRRWLCLIGSGGPARGLGQEFLIYGDSIKCLNSLNDWFGGWLLNYKTNWNIFVKWF